MSVCLSHGGPSLYETNAPATELLIATIDGVVILTRSGADKAWQASHRALEGKHVSALLVEPSRGFVYAGTHGDSLYVSENRGKTWQRTDQGLRYGDIYSLNAAQTHGELRLFAGTEPAHLFISRDLGENWQELSSLRAAPSVGEWTFPAPPHVAHVKNVTFDPRSAETIYASIEVGGLLKSTDQGATWRELDGFYKDVHRTVIPPSHPERLYITGGDGIYHSQDEGETWVHLTDRSMRIGYPDALIIHPLHQELLFTAGAVSSPGTWRKMGTANAGIGRSFDGGKTWQILERGLPEHIHGNIEAMSMNLWPGGFGLFAGTTDGEVFCSEDSGETWSTIAEGLPAVSKGGHYKGLLGGESAEMAISR